MLYRSSSKGSKQAQGSRGQSPLVGLTLFGGKNRDKSPYRVCISLLYLTTERLILKFLMHKNNIRTHISPSFIGAEAPCPYPYRSMKAYIRDYDDLVSLGLSFFSPFLFFSFLFFSFLFFSFLFFSFLFFSFLFFSFLFFSFLFFSFLSFPFLSFPFLTSLFFFWRGAGLPGPPGSAPACDNILKIFF